MRNHLKGFSNIPRTLRILKSGKAGLHDWQGLVKVRNLWLPLMLTTEIMLH